MSQDWTGQGRGRGGAWTPIHPLQLPVGVVGVVGVDGLDGVFLKASKVFMKAVAALVVEAVAVVIEAVVVVEFRGRPSVLDVDHVAAALPPQGGLTAG